MIIIMPLSLICQGRFDHIHHWQLIILPYSVYYRIVFVKHTISMEFVLFERTIILLSIFEKLDSFPIEHSIVPWSFILFVSSFSEKCPISTLHSISELAFIPTSISPPKCSSSISLSFHELTFIKIWLFARPLIQTPSILFIEFKFSHIVISTCKVKLTHSFKLPIFEFTKDDFLRIFIVAEPSSMRPVNFCLSDINDILVLVEFRGVKFRLHGKD